MRNQFIRYSNLNRIVGAWLRTHARKAISTVSALVLIATLGFSLVQITGGNAQSELSFIRKVRMIEADEIGLTNPAGIAFSTTSNAFHVADARQGKPNQTDLVKVTPLSARAGLVQISEAAQDPINMVFDDRFNRLLLLAATGDQILAVSQDHDGNLKSAGVTQYNVKGLGLQNPQGMTVDEETGTLFILDAAAPRIVQVHPLSDGSFEGASLSEINLQSHLFSSLRGIAFEPSSGHFFVNNSTDQKLYEVTSSGELASTRDLAPFALKDLQAMVFAPSGDQTDDAAQMSLYVADSGLAEEQTPGADPALQGNGQIVELSFTALTEPAAAAFTASLVRTTNLGAVSPPIPDPSGVAYLSGSHTLMIVDGEVEETVQGISHFQGANVWELTLLGDEVRTANISNRAPTVTPITNEPTDIAWNPNNRHYYVANDEGDRVYDVNPGGDGLIGTSDDTWTFFSTSGAGSGDPEGIAFNPQNNHLFVADGNNAEVYEYTTSGNLVNHFDVGAYGAADPESIAFSAETGTLFTMSSNRATPVIVETTITGTFLQTINIAVTNAEAAAGLAYAPASDGSGARRFYIVDRGIDNNTNPNIVDGKLYELTTPSFGPTLTPSNSRTPTATNIGAPTNTRTATITRTPTITRTATNTRTPTITRTPGSTTPPTSIFTVTSTSSGADLIFKDGFESGSFSAWSANSNNAGRLSVSTGAALQGNYGLQAAFTNKTNMFVRNDSPTGETRYRARFYFNPNSISMATGDNITLFQGLDAGGTIVFSIQFNRSSTGYQLRARSYDSGLAAFVSTPYFTITNAVHTVEVDWGNDGHFTFWIDGAQQANLTGINNSVYRIETVRLGAPTMAITGTSGTFYIDTFESRRSTYIGP